MQIEIREAGASATIVLNGRLDIVGAEAIALPLATLSGKKNTLFVDMSRVTFIASIGLRYLVAASKAVSRRGGQLVLIDPNDAVIEVIGTSGLSDLLPHRKDRASGG